MFKFFSLSLKNDAGESIKSWLRPTANLMTCYSRVVGVAPTVGAMPTARLTNKAQGDELIAWVVQIVPCLFVRILFLIT
ncbi:MAG: hypothetical protein RIR39_63 [Pseudomonadota bacterium]